ncbi:ABC transporter ATP-binding protein [Nocardioides sp. MAHUQ-72]|uniref:ABC transporter ATP-binding protein n=1 Tax=unclassified Nocardioides TaxID=2615069 RepID=UPI00361BF727
MNPILDIEDLAVSFASGGQVASAVRGVSFDVAAGERIGIVGESGSGKSVTAQAIMRLLPSTAEVSGAIRFAGEDINTYDRKRLTRLRGAEIAMIFQDPMSSLNPLMRVGKQITETLRRHRGLGRSEAREEAIRLLRTVGIADAEARMRDYPHAFSGGMRQRVCIAIAASCAPQLIIADEPTTALDVTVQGQVLDLLDKLTDDHGTAAILISHDLGVVSSFCDRVLIMYAGRIVEVGPTERVVHAPQHPYTRALLDSIPRMDRDLPHRLPGIPGAPPQGADDPEGCPFAARCPRATQECLVSMPAMTPTSAALAPSHAADPGATTGGPSAFACFHPLGADAAEPLEVAR